MVSTQAKVTIDTIRTLAMDAVQAANSGHPGTPMALAPVAYAVWQEALRFDPQDPLWPDRDRFVLSCGHASMLLYGLLHLAGVKRVRHGKVEDAPAVSLEDLKRFRQMNSATPGHPEYGWTGGVETTTGPLGQGVATSVGMAIAAKWLAARYNRPGFELFQHRVYVICSDGDLMEGISAEASSLAGHLGLDNLIWIYDNNGITIEGHTDLAFSEDIAARFKALGWGCSHVADANDLDALGAALEKFQRQSGAPQLLIVDSHIGYGAPHKQDSHAAHGEPLGEEEIKLTKAAYGWPPNEKFLVPAEARAEFASGVGKRGAEGSRRWRELFQRYKAEFPEPAAELEQIWSGALPADWDSEIPRFAADPKGMGSREASGKVLNAIGKRLPWMVGGSADLAPSTKTWLGFEGAGEFGKGNRAGRNLHWGIRELGMGAAVNGMALSGLRSFGASFLVFTDYARPAIRLAALMEIPALFIFTHDSIGLGEDGPTHQPIEHLASLRAIPQLLVFRPGDANETAECYRAALSHRDRPSLLALSRQALPTIDRQRFRSADGVAKGAYLLAEAPSGTPQAIIMASGSELPIALEAWEQLTRDGVQARVVSFPCWELFEAAPESYRDAVLPPQVKARVSIEAASTFGWHRWVGPSGIALGIDRFGASAPYKELYEKFGLTAARVVAAVRAALAR